MWKFALPTQVFDKLKPGLISKTSQGNANFWQQRKSLLGRIKKTRVELPNLND